MGKRPGIMVYFDILDALEEYEAEERGLLFTAMLRYGLYGEIPEFEDRGMRTIWKSAQQKIDLDGVRYENTCNGRRYSLVLWRVSFVWYSFWHNEHPTYYLFSLFYCRICGNCIV